MANALVVTAVAHDQLSVGTTIDSLITANGIVSAKLINVEVTPFGENQFLVTVLYSS